MGKLNFDFVSTVRPIPGMPPISDEALERVLYCTFLGNLLTERGNIASQFKTAIDFKSIISKNSGEKEKEKEKPRPKVVELPEKPVLSDDEQDKSADVFDAYILNKSKFGQESSSNLLRKPSMGFLFSRKNSTTSLNNGRSQSQRSLLFKAKSEVNEPAILSRKNSATVEETPTTKGKEVEISLWNSYATTTRTNYITSYTHFLKSKLKPAAAVDTKDKDMDDSDNEDAVVVKVDLSARNRLVLFMFDCLIYICLPLVHSIQKHTQTQGKGQFI